MRCSWIVEVEQYRGKGGLEQIAQFGGCKTNQGARDNHGRLISFELEASVKIDGKWSE
jgi:hypothetical protein